ncbi:MAG TPA: head GIN domain-containing protein [Flavobacterium sp.]|jgi:hypothetical protein
MKKVLLIAAFVITQIAAAQVTKNVGDFDEISVFDRISVEIVPSDQNKVVITGDRSRDVEVVNNNGKLKIRMALEKLLNGEEIHAVVYCRGIKSIEASEGSYVGSAATISQNALHIDAKEGAEIKMTVDVKKLNTRAVTGGKVTVSGSAVNQDIKIGTGGIVEAKSLVTVQTSVSINAGGEAEVNASDLVDANIKAGGNVVVYGNPKQIDEKTTLGGSVKRARE